MLQRPDKTEYSAYFARYVELVPDGDLPEILNNQRRDLLALLAGVTEEQAESRYEAGKWSVKEVLGHIADTERIMSYRALCIARGEKRPLPGFDQDEYTAAANFNRLTLPALLADFTAARASTLSLFAGFGDEDWLRQGSANHSTLSVRALGYITAGHALHHSRVLQEKYLR